MNTPIHTDVRVAVLHVATSPYRSLNIVQKSYSHWIVSHVLEGRVTTTTDGATWHARGGDVMVHPARAPFDEIAAGPGTHQWILFDARTEVGLDLFNLYPVEFVVRLNDAAAYGATFEQLRREWDGASPARDVHVAALALRLLGWVAEGASRRRGGHAVAAVARHRFSDIIRHMAAHLEQPLTRAQLARMAHLHPTHFDRAFSAEHGQPPMRLLREMRLQRTRRLLEGSDHTLDHIAAECGLRDAAYLGRVFHKRFGLTPGQHRARVKSASSGYVGDLTR